MPAAAARSSFGLAPTASSTRSAGSTVPSASLTCATFAVALDRGEPRAEPDVDAAAAMEVLHEVRDHRRGDALHHAILGLQHGDVAPLPARDRRDLEPDVAAADDDDVLRGIERRSAGGARRRSCAARTRRRGARPAPAGRARACRSQITASRIRRCRPCKVDAPGWPRSIDGRPACRSRRSRPARPRISPDGNRASRRAGARSETSSTAAGADTAHRARRRSCGSGPCSRPGAGSARAARPPARRRR